MTKHEKQMVRKWIVELEELSNTAKTYEDALLMKASIATLKTVLWKFRYNKPTKKRRRA